MAQRAVGGRKGPETDDRHNCFPSFQFQKKKRGKRRSGWGGKKIWNQNRIEGKGNEGLGGTSRDLPRNGETIGTNYKCSWVMSKKKMGKSVAESG